MNNTASNGDAAGGDYDTDDNDSDDDDDLDADTCENFEDNNSQWTTMIELLFDDDERG